MQRGTEGEWMLKYTEYLGKQAGKSKDWGVETGGEKIVIDYTCSTGKWNWNTTCPVAFSLTMLGGHVPHWVVIIFL